MDAAAAAAGGHRWTEEVDDLVDAGDVDGAISLLESVVSSLSTAASPPRAGADLRLATALGDLAGLHASRGNTLQADAIRSRAIVLRLRAQKEAPQPQALGDHAATENSASPEAATGSKDSKASASVDKKDEDEDDDWEAIADRGDETPVRPLVQEARVTTPCSSSEKSSTSSSGTKRRGRGSFLYDKSVLYSDQCASERDLDDKGSDPAHGRSKGRADEKDNKDAAKRFGTRHALVLYDFPPSTRTTDLERIFEKFGDHGVAIRWVNDSVALAVFRTPSSAKEAQASVPPRYKVRPLKDNDDLLAKIDGTDLEPPTPRPKTSARTAQRLIAHGMGLKQFTTMDAGERKEQEEARRSRITARQAARDDAWGED
ncbi:uncharacterized protein LOC119278865 [Triticum dicoccoides]|uniref:RRM domain-containing protein n=1 Tax=Triticum aestivum TaxID=4565 RepID=A0A080YU72_WHEAT|nr:uncharacterized protein LOC119278865 [Triticum dicoccoides]XP_044352298.1 uncharacterized protein LOC123072737 [Triticum aestivum]CDM86932.1 unnamed protein product [Triticum aestivum]